MREVAVDELAPVLNGRGRMTQQLFLNLPVADVARSAAFYEAIGFTKDERFSSEAGACMQLSDSISFMLMSHDSFLSFSPKPIADAHQVAQALICISRESRQAVDAMVEAAVAAGGKGDLNEPDEHGFMYGRSFEDPDGHMFGPMWMDIDAAMAAASQQPAEA